MYKINLDYINAVAPAQSTEQARYYLNCVYIEDANGYRNYTATNGHILLTCKEELTPDDERLPKGLMLRTKAIKKPKGYIYAMGELIKPELLNIQGVACIELIDGSYPDYERIIPQNTSEINEYIAFDGKYLQMVEKFIDNYDIYTHPHGEGNGYAVLWENGDKRAVLMPYRR